MTAAETSLAEARALASALCAAGDPRGELLALEIAAVEAGDAAAARAQMRDLSARRGGLARGLAPWTTPDEAWLAAATWTASGLAAAAELLADRDEPLRTSPAGVGLGEARVRAVTRSERVVDRVEEARARWPRLARLVVGCEVEQLGALSEASRARVTALDLHHAAGRLALPPMAALCELRSSSTIVDLDRLEAPALTRVEGRLGEAAGASLARRAPRLRALACEEPTRAWSWLAEHRALEVFALRAGYQQIGDLSALCELPRLRRVELSARSLQEAPVLPLGRMPQLRSLRIDGTPWVTPALGDAAGLEELEVAEALRGRTRSLEFLRGLPRLRALILHVRPSSFAPISALTELRRLVITAPWGRLGSLASLRRLGHLALRDASRPLAQRTFDRLRLDALDSLCSLEISWAAGELDLSRLTGLRSLSIVSAWEATLRLPPNLERLVIRGVRGPSQLLGLDGLEALRGVELRDVTVEVFRRFVAALPAVRVVRASGLWGGDPLFDLRHHGAAHPEAARR